MAELRVETNTSYIWLRKDGIICVENKPAAQIEQVDARWDLDAVASFADGRRCPIMVDGTLVRTMSREARQLLSGPEAAEVIVAQGLVVNAPVARVVGNFFLGLNKPVFPTKLFSSPEQALEWLRAYL